MNWVQCEECEKWYHYICVGLNKKAVQKMERYECFRCKDVEMGADAVKEDEVDNVSNTSLDGVR